jgi:hypothetical protein
MTTKRNSFLSMVFFCCVSGLAFSQSKDPEGNQKPTLSQLLCNKLWLWDEGIKGRILYEPAVFSVQYDNGCTFCFNSRQEKNFWKITDDIIEHRSENKNSGHKNHHGIFNGKYKISKLTDSVLILSKINPTKPSKTDTLKFIWEGIVPVSGKFDSFAVNETERQKKEKFDYWMKRGNDFLSEQKYLEALIAFKNALKIKPDDPAAKAKLNYCDNGISPQKRE